ncbi:hypothetical protein AKO1_012661 [Acrasis kona]|uniref:Complex 1 LYR protein domain-containing protein n=1 Tax=Acrasis kona TaxID=1008807 RepID=A0AAW2YLH6_9EUKA
MSTRNATLTLYRNLIKQAQYLPSEKRISATTQIKKEFRENKSNHEDTQRLLKNAESRLSFMKMMSPRRTEQKSMGSTFVIREGKLIEATPQQADKASHSNWGAGNVNPDEIEKHHRLLRRQNFMEGPLKRR